MVWYDRPGLRWLRLLRLELHRQTDILAAAAFVISISGLVYQGALSIQKPELVQFPPEQIQFFADGDYTNIAARLSCVNKGNADKSATLTLVRLVFYLSGKSYELKWQTFEEFSSEGTVLKRSTNPRPAAPKVIKSGEAFTEEIKFSPRTLPVTGQSEANRFKNYLPWGQLVTELAKLEELDVQIISEFYGREDQKTKVYIQITPVLIKSLRENRWYTSSCWPRPVPSPRRIKLLSSLRRALPFQFPQ